MEQRIYDAAVSGDITYLVDLTEKDPLLFDKAILNCQDKSPLHIAVMFGHVNVVKYILRYSFDMCLVPDRFGRTPFHLAAIKGRLDVLQELIHARPLSAREKTAGGDTVLHLCVKYKQLQALKMLVRTIKDRGFANMKNDEGMTVLHLAVCDEQIETIIYLLGNKMVDVNAKNANGDTALDLFGGKTDIEIARCLRIAGAKRGKEIASSEVNWLHKKREALMVVSSLIATMAFQAGVSPPGGVWQDDSNGSKPHMAGEAVMAQKDPKYYRHFVRANTVAFISSLSIILLLIISTPVKRNKFVMWALMLMTVATAALTYGISILMVTPVGDRKRSSQVMIAVIMWAGLMLLLLLGNILLLNRWLRIHGIDLSVNIKRWYWAVPQKTNDSEENSQMYSV